MKIQKLAHQFLIPIILFSVFLFNCSPINKPNELEAIYNLIDRKIPGASKQFILELYKDTNCVSSYEISSFENKILLRGTDKIAISKAFNHYLQHYRNANISRGATQIQQTEKLPIPKNKISQSTQKQYRYYLNYCTYNYSMSFWDWTDWEQEIDWMALHGINLPLAIIGTEAVWQNTLRQFNFSEKEILAFIPGPAYTAWWLMDNIEGWGGPVSQKWIDSRVTLQQKILARMRELGMQPVLPAFYGMAPNLLIEKYPDNKIFKDGEWAGHQRPAFIDPTDSLFNKMAKIFYAEQEKLYGKALFYSGDPFHEGGKKMGNLTTSALIIQKCMQTHSEKATWILQGWQESPTYELLAGTDKQHTIILDLFGEAQPFYEKRKSFNDRNFIWCNVNNFGNNTYMYANIDSIINVPIKLLKHQYSTNFKGIGLCVEGNLTDPLIYDLFYDVAWQDKTFNLNEWIKAYSTSRYGQENNKTTEAINLLTKTVYNAPYRTENVLCARPSLTADRVTSWAPTVKPIYSQDSLKQALKLLLSVEDQYIINTETYKFDVANITRQIVTGIAFDKLQKIRKSFENKDIQNFIKYKTDFLNLILYTDSLVSNMQGYSLYEWQQKAKNSALDTNQTQLFVWNANRIITLWANEKGAEWLHDYSYREWYGLLSNFYYQRWNIYFDFKLSELENKKVKEPDFYNWENNWAKQIFEYKEGIKLDLKKFSKKVLLF